MDSFFLEYVYKFGLAEATWFSSAHNRSVSIHSADPTASAGVLDSQSVKATEVGRKRGFDGGKRLTGRKYHPLAYTEGLPVDLAVRYQRRSPRRF
jgi:hypothetical protein